MSRAAEPICETGVSHRGTKPDHGAVSFGPMRVMAPNRSTSADAIERRRSPHTALSGADMRAACGRATPLPTTAPVASGFRRLPPSDTSLSSDVGRAAYAISDQGSARQSSFSKVRPPTRRTSLTSVEPVAQSPTRGVHANRRSRTIAPASPRREIAIAPRRPQVGCAWRVRLGDSR